MKKFLIVALMLTATPALADECTDLAELGEVVAMARDQGQTAEQVAQHVFKVKEQPTQRDLLIFRSLVKMVYSNALLNPEEIYGKAYALCWIGQNQ
jgi:hypothetical protein